MSTSVVSKRHKGNFKRTYRYFDNLSNHAFLAHLEKYGQLGVQALQAATPVRTGKTQASWSYRIVVTEKSVSLVWENSNKDSQGNNIVKMLVHGHGTRNGHYVPGNNFVSPAIQPILQQIADELSKEVSK